MADGHDGDGAGGGDADGGAGDGADGAGDDGASAGDEHAVAGEGPTESGESAPDGEAGTADTPELTHVADGEAGMVGVTDKPERGRRARAAGRIDLRPATVRAVEAGDVGKGEVFPVARVGAVQAVKRTPESIPLCHAIPITDVDVAFETDDEGVACTVAVETVARTGPEMEAIQGVTAGLAVVWDMVKSAEKDDDGAYPGTRIHDVRVLEKSKGPAVGDGAESSGDRAESGNGGG